MIEIFNKNKDLIIQNSDNKQIVFNTETSKVLLDSFDVSHPGEYEKSGILLEVMDYNETLFYNFLIDSKHVVIITNDDFEIKEDILSFFGDVDVLVIKGSKRSAELFENIEAKLVVPYGESKSIFLNTLGQHSEELESYKVKSDFSLDNTDFVNLK